MELDEEIDLVGEEIADAATKVRGQESEKQLVTAKNHFNRFLQIHCDGVLHKRTCDTILYREVTQELLGRFGTYLFMQLAKLSGALSYISQVKTFFVTKWSREKRWSLHPSVSGEGWYANIREGMTKMYTNRAIANGETLVDQAPPMYQQSLRQVATALFVENKPPSYQDRDLLVTQWHCMGRAGELGLRHSAVKFVGLPTGALQFAVGRSKTSKLQNIHAFCDAESWEADIFHSKACHLLTSSNVDDVYQFANASASVINRMLARVSSQCDSLPYKFQSHSSRRGCASEALSHSGVAVTEVIARGGWSFDAVSKVFLYFSGMDQGDLRVGRVVAGWSDSDHGGIPPKYDSVGPADMPVIRSLARHLFRHVLGKYGEEFVLVLTASVVMYYNAVETVWKTRGDICHAHVILRQAIDAIGSEECKLAAWSTLIYDAWLLSNLPWIRHELVATLSEEAKSTTSVSVATFRDVMDRLVAGQHETAKQMAKLTAMVLEQQRQISALTDEIRQTATVTRRIDAALAAPSIVQQPPAVPLFTRQIVLKPTAHHDAKVSKPSTLPKSLAGIRASQLFLDFLSNGWYSVVLQASEKDVMRKIRLVVARVRDFLPAECVLSLPPQRGSDRFTSWYTELEQHVRMAEQQMLVYIANIKPDATKHARKCLLANTVNKDLAKANTRSDNPRRVCRDTTAVID